MLNNITNPEHFQECIKHVKLAYWPYDNPAYQKALKERFQPLEGQGACILNDAQRKKDSVVNDIQQCIDKEMSAFFADTCKKKLLYKVVGTQGELSIPFLSKFHTLFAKRKWQEPYCQPSVNVDDLLRLAPVPIIKECKNKNRAIIKASNYSENYGNYCHFVNVVAALSHLIYFFSDREWDSLEDAIWLDNQTWNIIKYPTKVCVRKFKLMLAGFYHDIGKTVVDHRHAMEGYIILSSYQSEVLRDILLLAKKYRDDSGPYNLDREALLFIADMVYYHDLYGTLSTGENGYVRLISLIERIERHCHKEGKEISKEGKEIPKEGKEIPKEGKKISKGKEISKKEERKISLEETGKQHIFDLWLLNVADILVSVKSKWELQREWVESGLGEREKDIRNFFKKPDDQKQVGNFIDQGHDLLHDLKLTFELFGIYVNDQFTNSQSPFKPAVLKCSYYHNVARIRKLVKNSLFPKVAKLADGVDEELKEVESKFVDLQKGLLHNGENRGDLERIKRSCEVLRSFYKNIVEIERSALDKTIETSIRSGTDYAEFFKRFSWIGQLDYSLGFFRKLSEHAIDKVATQMNNVLLRKPSDHTGWISDNPGVFGDQLEEWGEINSRYFVDNYVEIVVQIINYLLFRDPFNEHVLNFEFEDAGKRLTEDKIKRILFFEGPARSTKSTMLILETVFIY
ncbi:MAG: hypothetical protein BWK78_06010 [Thiotrichaceae bacterium IS1]|nr:MAG: hypothetical protein BWK78_06010 [Thiotrichaceae bacterium IS1]